VNLVQVDAVALKTKAARSSQTFDRTHYTTQQKEKKKRKEKRKEKKNII